KCAPSLYRPARGEKLWQAGGARFLSVLFLSYAKQKALSAETDRALKIWLRGPDVNQRPSGDEPDELPDCSTPRPKYYNKLSMIPNYFPYLGTLFLKNNSIA